MSSSPDELKPKLSLQILEKTITELKEKDEFNEALIEKFQRLISLGSVTSVEQLKKLLLSDLGDSNEDP